MSQNNKKILIVEDEKLLAKAVKTQLEEAGYEAVVVFDGEAALDSLSKNKFDLILLDLLLPKINGLDVLTEIKKRQIKTPVIVISNLGDATEIQKTKELGAAKYLIKSDIALADVLTQVQNMIG